MMVIFALLFTAATIYFYVYKSILIKTSKIVDGLVIYFGTKATKWVGQKIIRNFRYETKNLEQ